MITALEASRLLPDDKLEKDLHVLDRLIRNAAAQGETSIRVPHEIVKRKPCILRFKTPGLQEALVAAGYKVFSRRVDRQLSDVWIEISWAGDA